MLPSFYLDSFPPCTRVILPRSNISTVTSRNTPPRLSISILICSYMITSRQSTETGEIYILESLKLFLINVISPTIPLSSGTPNYNLVWKLLPMTLNTLPLVSVLTIFLACVIIYAISEFHFTWSMVLMHRICLAIMFWLSIRPSCLP